MPEIYRTAQQPALDESSVLVVHCSDPRYQPHFQDFLRQGLRLDHYALIAVPGGPQFLALSEYLPKFAWAGWRWVKFMMDLSKPDRVILIAHDDCRWYLDMRFWAQSGGMRERQVGDLQKVRSELAGRFSGSKVELYYAKLVEGRAGFEAL